MSLRKIIVIGASSGIGRKIAELYAEKKYKVGITGRRNPLLQEIKQQFPEQIETACFDITADDCLVHLQELVQRMQGMDTLILSAGVGEPDKDLSWEIDKMTVDTNVNGFLKIANWAFHYFEKKGSGRLAFISSVAAYRGGLHAPAYNASKAFQSSYAYGLALRAERISPQFSVTCVEPGFVATKMAKGHRLFWVVPVHKAARQIIHAVEKRKRQAFISRRWRLIAYLLRFLPHCVYKRMV
ncbi:MAG: SDR family NAD(P)-dependent oxidoreductase [Chitinophagaceae bacterium]|nr:SDR family NAD(P)-dependent oxidoreductase [Chitinophagaceae bacterium]